MRPTACVAADVRPIRVADLLARQDLVRSHWHEVDGRDGLDIDWKRLRVLEAQEMLLALGVIEDGKLLGYTVGLVLHHHHRRAIVYYQNEGLFVAPDARRRGIGPALVRATEQHAMGRGATVFSWHAKAGSSADRLLRAMNYEEREVVLQRETP